MGSADPHPGSPASSIGDESSTNPRRRPLVGITTYPENDRGRYDLPESYVACVRRAGADVVLIPPDATDAVGVLGHLDGLVLAGGGDIDPSRYGGTGHPTIYSLSEGRDRDESAMVVHVLETGLPTLAICRGSQVLNVTLGGTLHAHLPDVVDGSVTHRDEPRALRGEPAPVPHEVRVEPGSLVAEVMGAERVTPMSWHHQAIDRIGADLRPVAWAPDGTIEATEHAQHPWLASVQWHPELTGHEDPTQQALFDGLVRASS